MQIPFPNKKYNIIYADPPWHFQNYNNAKAQTNPENHYSTMSLKEIGELPVKDITDKDWGGTTDTAYPDSGQSVGVPSGIKGTDLAGSPFETSHDKSKASRYEDGNDDVSTFGFLDV